MIAPRENGSLLAPTSWFPSTATMPKRGPQPLELLDHLPRCPRMAHDVAGQRHQVGAALDAEVDRLPKCAHVERRRPGVEVAQVQDREAVELGAAGRRRRRRASAHSTHCDSKRPHAAAPASGRGQGAESPGASRHARSRARRAGDPGPCAIRSRSMLRRSSSPEWPLPDAAIGSRRSARNAAAAAAAAAPRTRARIQRMRGFYPQTPHRPLPPIAACRSSAANSASWAVLGEP